MLVLSIVLSLVLSLDIVLVPVARLPVFARSSQSAAVWRVCLFGSFQKRFYAVANRLSVSEMVLCCRATVLSSAYPTITPASSPCGRRGTSLFVLGVAVAPNFGAFVGHGRP